MEVVLNLIKLGTDMATNSYKKKNMLEKTKLLKTSSY